MRKYGLTIDQLLSVDWSPPAGEFVKASANENADLFWGVRGGGGNFGIVTEFEFRLNPVGPMVLAGPIFWPMEDSPQVLRFYRDWITEVPDELTTIVIHRKAPALPIVPAELHGRPVVVVAVCYAGPVEEGERVVRPLREFGAPLLDLCAPKPFVDAPGDVRPLLPARLVVLHPLLRRRRAERRGDRHHRRARAAHAVAGDRLPDLPARRRGRAGGRGRDGVQRPRRRPHHQHQRHDGDGRGLRRRSASGRAPCGRRSRRTTRAST